MAVAMISALTRRPVRRTIAMTGEITLRGQVLPVGGIKEKILAARRAGIKNVILPELCRRQLEDFPADMRKQIGFLFVEEVEQVFDAALMDPEQTPSKRRPSRGRRVAVVQASQR